MQRLKREAICRELDLGGLDSLEINQLVKEIGRRGPRPVFSDPSPRPARAIRCCSGHSLDRLMADGVITIQGSLLAGKEPHLPAVALDLDAELETRLERVDRTARTCSAGPPFSATASRPRSCKR